MTLILKKRFLLFIILFIFSLFLNNYIFAENNLSQDLYCNNDLIMDANTGNILFEKGGYEKVYPASTTKILTAILALENLKIDETITASSKAIYSTPVGSSVAYIKPGEELSLENLLYCLLIVSGNDAANVIAESVSGNNSKFIELMNLKLQEIGCTNTHFTNAHGFHDNNHYTTPYDMAILMKYAMQNETFRKVIETKEVIIPQTNKSDERKCKSTNKMFNSKYENVYYEYILGGKTGFTDEARGAFVGYGKKDDKLVIVCAFDGSQNVNGDEARFLDSKTLLNYAFDNFNKHKVINIETFKFKIKDENNFKIYTISIPEDSYSLCGGNKIYNSYNITLNTTNFLKNEDSVNIGTIEIAAFGDNLDITKTEDLKIIEKADYFYFPLHKYAKIIKYIVLVTILIILIKILKKNKKKLNRKSTKIKKHIN